MTRQQRAFAINLGSNTLLDVARKTFQETIDDINEYTTALGRHFDLPLQVKYKIPTWISLESFSSVLIWKTITRHIL